MMLSARQQRQRLRRLAMAIPAADLVLSEDVGDVVCAWPADRRDIEMVAAGGAYDAWARPQGSIVQDRYNIRLSGRPDGQIIDEPGLRLVRSDMTLREAAAWLKEALQGRLEARPSFETELADEVMSAIRSMRS
jgi:hypothetical protein